MHGFWHRFFRLNAAFICRWLEQLFPGPPIGGVLIFHKKGVDTVAEITVHDDETTLRATITPVDAEGNATTPDTTPVWSVGDESVLTVHAADDGLSATFDVGSPGASAVTVEFDETHEGVGDPTHIILSGLVTVIAGDTVGGEVTFATG